MDSIIASTHALYAEAGDYCACNEFDKALECYEEAISVWRQYENHEELSMALLKKACLLDLLERTNDWGIAMAHAPLSEICIIANGNSDVYDMAMQMLNNLPSTLELNAHIEARKGNRVAAMQLFEKAASMCRRRGHMLHLGQILMHQARLTPNKETAALLYQEARPHLSPELLRQCDEEEEGLLSNPSCRFC